MIDEEKKRRILDYIRGHETHENSKNSMMRDLKLSHPTLTKILDALVESKQVRELTVGTAKIYEVK